MRKTGAQPVSKIAIGTACFLVNVHAEILGRVVEVVTPAVDLGDVTGRWHQVEAPWTHVLYPGQQCFTQPENLLPIAGPRLGERMARKEAA